MGAKPEFVHLHNHSEYSLLDGITRWTDHDGGPSELLKSLAHDKARAVAVTDHGNLFGAIEFYSQCNKVGVKPIIGCEMYLAKGSRHAKGGSQKDNCHLTVLARNYEGYQNLMALSTVGFLEGFYYDARIDRELLAKHSKGLVVLSGCLKSEISQAITAGNLQQAIDLVGQYKDILEPECFYLEIMDHGLEKQRQVLKALLEIRDRTKLPLVVTNDCHYAKKSDFDAHDARVCISTGRKLADTNRLKFESHEFYFKTPEEMHKIFSFAPEGLANTLKIAEMCNLQIPMDQLLLPIYSVPAGYNQDSYLEHLCREGLKRKKRDTDKYRERLQYELGVIKKMGFSGYFLIVWDFISHAKKIGVPVGPGRGSGAGALVSYTLDITLVDPLEHSLLFERFLNPDRKSMPDLDIDFSDEGRERVIEYVRNKYGEANVARIITFSSMAARAAIRDVGRVLDTPLAEVDKLAKMIPFGQTIHKTLETSPELKDAAKSPEINKLLTLAQKLEGLKRNTSVHAAGIVITKDPVVTYSALSKGSNNDVITTQYDGEVLPKLGLLKMDFLGLRTLSIMQHAIENINARRPDAAKPYQELLDSIPLEDAKTFQLLQSGKTLGVFQLDSEGIRDLVRKLKPTLFTDVVALVALYRPGPMKSGMVDDFVARKHGEKKIVYDHALLKPILQDSYGCMVYQEQVMEISKSMAGFTGGQADGLRKAMGKKDPVALQKVRGDFVAGSKKNGVADKLSNKIFDQMAEFAGYAFNKCLAGNTRIFDAETGRAWTVGDLCRKQKLLAVWTLGKDGKRTVRRMRRVWSNGVKPVYRLTTGLGHELVATDNHPLYTFGGWKNLGELKPGDRIATPRALPGAGTTEWDKSRATLLGWVLSEGNTCHPSGFYMYSKDPVQVADMVRAAEAFPNTATTVAVRQGCHAVYVRAAEPQAAWNKGLSGASLTNREPSTSGRSGARKWLDSLGICGLKATSKHMPAEVFELTDKCLAVFVGRLWSGDGYVYGANTPTPFYATSSVRLARDVQDILLRLGILSKIHRKSFPYRGGLRAGYAIHVITRESVKRFIDVVGPHLVGRDEGLSALTARLVSLVEDRMSKDTVPAEVSKLVRDAWKASGNRWAEVEAATGVCIKEYCSTSPAKKGFRRWTLSALAEHFDSAELRRHAEADIFWDTVVSIQPEGEEETFDIEVPGTHNFVADGLYVHNSHSAAYGLVAYQTAWMKANYPLEFMTALLTSEIGHSAMVEGKENKLVTYLNEAKAMGIEVLPPDIQKSEVLFSMEGPAIRFGLVAIKNVGQGAAESIVAARRDGAFKSLDDFCRRVDMKACNKKVFESLIKGGAMDCLKPNQPVGLGRAALAAAVEETMDREARVKEDVGRGQGLLFGADAAPETNGAPAEVQALHEHDILKSEKEVLGFYLSGHPLVRYEDRLKLVATHTIEKLGPEVSGQVRLAGMIVQVKKLLTKEKGEQYARGILEDLTGEVTILVFPRKYAEGLGKLMNLNAIVSIAGRLSLRGDVENQTPELIVDEIQLIDTAVARLARRLTIPFSTAALEKPVLEDLRRVLAKHPGRCPVTLRLDTPAHGTSEVETDTAVRLEESLFDDLEKVLGEKTWQIESAS